jgi:hypothetical protein
VRRCSRRGVVKSSTLHNAALFGVRLLFWRCTADGGAKETSARSCNEYPPSGRKLSPRQKTFHSVPNAQKKAAPKRAAGNQVQQNARITRERLSGSRLCASAQWPARQSQRKRPRKRVNRGRSSLLVERESAGVALANANLHQPATAAVTRITSRPFVCGSDGRPPGTHADGRPFC